MWVFRCSWRRAVLGFVLTVVFGVGVYSQDPFAGIQLEDGKTVVHNMEELLQLTYQIQYYTVRHPEFVDCDRQRDVLTANARLYGQLLNMTGLAEEQVAAQYRACQTTKSSVLFLPMTCAVAAFVACFALLAAVARRVNKVG